MLRLAVLGYMWDLAYLVALPVGAWLFDNGCYNCVFGTSVVLYVLACFLGVIRLWGFFVPIFHNFNANDNLIIMLACASSVSSRLVRALAKTQLVFFVSTACCIWMYISSAPIRAQMTSLTGCVTPEELGKVNTK